MAEQERLTVVRPSEDELAAARAAFGVAADGSRYTCGCIAALLRDPFFPPLISHWAAYHAGSLAILHQTQANRLQQEARG